MGCVLCGMPIENASGWCGKHTSVTISWSTGQIIDIQDLRYVEPLFYVQDKKPIA